MRSHFALVGALALAVSLPIRAHAQKEVTLYNFTGGADGSHPNGLVFDTSGNLYGTTFFGGTINDMCLAGCGTVFQLVRSGGGWTLNTLHSFAGNSTDTGHPVQVIVDSHGNLYGPGETGGGPSDSGGIFELTRSKGWKESVIYGFTPKTGNSPAELTLHNGAFYGATAFGPERNGQVGYGTLYELALDHNGQWKHTIIHAFRGTDGYEPAGNPVFDPQGHIYGSVPFTFTNQAGEIFELERGKKAWNLRVIDDVGGGDMIFDKSGNLYFSLGGGGSSNCDGGCGSVVELKKTASGWKQITLYEFTDVRDGEDPTDLVFGADGSLYGTTFLGGTGSCVFFQFSGCGTVFKLTHGSGGWRKTTLYNFTGGSDGEFPSGAPLVMDASGNLYGATAGGASFGSSGFGTIYEIQQ